MLQILINAIGICLFMGLIPAGMGMLVMQAFPQTERKVGMTLVAGYVTSFVLFELTTLPIVLLVKKHNYKYVEIIYTLLSVLIALAGCLAAVWKKMKKQETYLQFAGNFPGQKAAWALVVFVLCYMLYMAVTHMSFDGDDSYYVVQSLITQQTGTMYTIAPYTGGSTMLDTRHAMALFTMWVAYLGSMTGVHTTILCHSVLPCIIIPLVLLIDLQIGRVLLKDKEKMLPFFVLFMELLYLFGYVSLYTNETFLLTRTWQGKALAGNFLFPVVMWLMLQLSQNLKNKGVWLLLTMVSGAAGLFSSLAVLLCVMLVAAMGFFLMLREKSFLLYVKLGCTCIPGVLYMGLYFVIGYVIWNI